MFIADRDAGRAALLLGFLVLGHGASACTLAMAPEFRAPAGRVAGMTFVLEHGAIEGVSNIPAGWRIAIDNDPSWMTKVTAQAVVGAAFLDGGHLPGLFSVRPEPQHGCSDVVRSGVALTLYRDDRLVRVRVRPSALRMTK